MAPAVLSNAHEAPLTGSRARGVVDADMEASAQFLVDDLCRTIHVHAPVAEAVPPSNSMLTPVLCKPKFTNDKFEDNAAASHRLTSLEADTCEVVISPAVDRLIYEMGCWHRAVRLAKGGERGSTGVFEGELLGGGASSSQQAGGGLPLPRAEPLFGANNDLIAEQFPALNITQAVLVACSQPSPPPLVYAASSHPPFRPPSHGASSTSSTADIILSAESREALRMKALTIVSLNLGTVEPALLTLTRDAASLRGLIVVSAALPRNDAPLEAVSLTKTAYGGHRCVPAEAWQQDVGTPSSSSNSPWAGIGAGAGVLQYALSLPPTHMSVAPNIAGVPPLSAPPMYPAQPSAARPGSAPRGRRPTIIGRVVRQQTAEAVPMPPPTPPARYLGPPRAPAPRTPGSLRRPSGSLVHSLGAPALPPSLPGGCFARSHGTAAFRIASLGGTGGAPPIPSGSSGTGRDSSLARGYEALGRSTVFHSMSAGDAGSLDAAEGEDQPSTSSGGVCLPLSGRQVPHDHERVTASAMAMDLGFQPCPTQRSKAGARHDCLRMTHGQPRAMSLGAQCPMKLNKGSSPAVLVPRKAPPSLTLPPIGTTGGPPGRRAASSSSGSSRLAGWQWA